MHVILMKLNGKAVQKALQNLEIEAELEQDQEFEQILVPLHFDPLEEETVMQIGLMQPEESQLQFIQFLLMLPIQIEKPFLANTQAFINLLNSVMEAPGFGIIDSERMPFYRYTMICHRHEVDEELFVMTVGMILQMIENYLETLVQICSGKKSYTQFWAEVQRAAE